MIISSPIWIMSPSPDAISMAMRLEDSTPPLMTFETSGELTASQKQFIVDNKIDCQIRAKIPYEGDWSNITYRLDNVSSFAPDLLMVGATLCSRRLREIIDMSYPLVQYFAVDDSRSSAHVREKDYMALYVHAVREVIDLDKSICIKTNLNTFGQPDQERVLAVRSMVLKADCQVDVPVFHDPNDGSLFVTDEFAEKAVRAGIEGITFLDPVSHEQRTG